MDIPGHVPSGMRLWEMPQTSAQSAEFADELIGSQKGQPMTGNNADREQFKHDPLQSPAKPMTPLIRDAIVQAAIEAGDGDMVSYLKEQAKKHPSAFLTLLGKVLPMQVTGVDGEVIKTRIEFSIVDPKQ